MKNFNALNELAAAYINGDESVFNELYMTSFKYCFCIAQEWLKKNPGAKADAEDIAAKVAYHILIDKLPSMEKTNGFKSYLRTSVKNKCMDLCDSAYFKKVQSTYQKVMDEDGEEQYIIDIAEDTTSNFNPERKLMECENRQDFYKAIDDLPENQKDAFLYYYENDETTYEDTAEHLSEKVSTIVGRINQAKAKLRKSLSEKIES